MSSSSHKQAILTGYIDHYCLVCESYIKTKEDLAIHIAKPIHKKNLETAAYLDKYKDDCVRKVKKGYYCEFCNLLLSTATKIGLHVAETKHNENKGAQLLKRVGNCIVAFRDILINEKAWNGLIDETCVTCNTEFDNEDIHKTEPTHILNLVQSKVEFSYGKLVYRKIDESSFQCLTCNIVLALSNLDTHFKQLEHKKLLTLYTESNEDLDIKDNCIKYAIEKPDPNINVDDVAKEKCNSTCLQSQEHLLKVEVKKLDSKQDIEATAVVKIENEKNTEVVPRMVIKPNETKIENKVYDINKTTVTSAQPNVTKNAETKNIDPCKFKKVTQDLDEAICEAMNAKDYITNGDKGERWCILCDWTMDSVAIQKHVTGRHHTTMLKMHKDRIQRKLVNDSTLVGFDTKTDVKTDEMVKAQSKVTQEKKENKYSDTATEELTKPVIIKQDPEMRHNIEGTKNMAVNDPTKTIIQTKTEIKETVEATKTTVVNNKTKIPETKKNQNKKRLEVDNSKELDEETEKFAQANELLMNRSNNKVYCRVCNSRIPFSLKNMKEHIGGGSHKNRVAKVAEMKQNTKIVTIKKRMKDFIKYLSAIENNVFKDVIINEKFCVNIFSFMMVTKGSYGSYCLPCDVEMRIEDLENHKTTSCHERAMCETQVIVTYESEFVREVRPGTYHCGFCNISELIEDFEDHLKTTAHRESKTAANWRLHQYMPDIIQDKREKRFEMLTVLHMLMNKGIF